MGRPPDRRTAFLDRMRAAERCPIPGPCADCLTTAGFIHRFDVKLKLLGDLTPEQREKLISIARRCPVYKTLTSEIRIEESLA